MSWQLRDPAFRDAIHAVLDRAPCALAGTVGAQVHVASVLGLEKLGPLAHAIEVVTFHGEDLPNRIDSIPVKRVDALGFEASVEAACSTVCVGEEEFRVASPEHVLGMGLGGLELPPDAKWACFLLMRTLYGRLDLEEVRGFLKRCPEPDRQSLLAELAYLAA
ncbi:MAG: hypothetical protein HYV07_23890 [Deltaproteobacteria bacterium]|nr:hypothetical protein [Deltaproteobacteria bacterium]